MNGYPRFAAVKGRRPWPGQTIGMRNSPCNVFWGACRMGESGTALDQQRRNQRIRNENGRQECLPHPEYRGLTEKCLAEHFFGRYARGLDT